MSLVFFHTADLNYRLQNKTALKQLLEDLFQKEGKRLEGLSIVFCSDDYLLSMNRQWTGRFSCRGDEARNHSRVSSFMRIQRQVKKTTIADAAKRGAIFALTS